VCEKGVVYLLMVVGLRPEHAVRRDKNPALLEKLGERELQLPVDAQADVILPGGCPREVDQLTGDPQMP